MTTEHCGWWCSKCGRMGLETEREPAQAAHDRIEGIACGYAVLMVPEMNPDRAEAMARVCLDVPTDSLRRLADAGGLAAVWEAVEVSIAILEREASQEKGEATP